MNSIPGDSYVCSCNTAVSHYDGDNCERWTSALQCHQLQLADNFPDGAVSDCLLTSIGSECTARCLEGYVQTQVGADTTHRCESDASGTSGVWMSAGNLECENINECDDGNNGGCLARQECVDLHLDWGSQQLLGHRCGECTDDGSFFSVQGFSCGHYDDPVQRNFCIIDTDVGAACPVACHTCPTCQDRWNNQGEVGIDCGGPCGKCTCTSRDALGNPLCKHEAVCMDDQRSELGYPCTCRAGYTGDSCEQDLDECASQPCEHDGTCTDSTVMASVRVDSYICECNTAMSHYDGDNCEQWACQDDPDWLSTLSYDCSEYGYSWNAGSVNPGCNEGVPEGSRTPAGCRRGSAFGYCAHSHSQYIAHFKATLENTLASKIDEKRVGATGDDVGISRRQSKPASEAASFSVTFHQED